MKRMPIFLSGFLMCMPLQAMAAAAMPSSPLVFKTARVIAPKVDSEYCRAHPFYRVTVLRNADGEIGGYVLQPAIRDAPIPYLDAEGEALTAFHIFAGAAEKRDAMNIITPLRQHFPIEEPLSCSVK